MKIIITTGQGIINLFDSAIALKRNRHEVKLITGWIPGKLYSDKFINLLGCILGRRNLAYGLNKRKTKELSRNEISSCSLSEFFIQFLFLVSKFKLISRDRAAFLGWKFYGYQSKRYLSDADIFHVRSGAGQGGAIKKAKKKGLKVVVDHSIAHPAEILKQLNKANDEKNWNGFISRDSKFWELVIKDCKMADLVVVNSDYVKESFVQNGFSPKIIHVVHMGITNIFHNLKSKWEIKDSPKILFIGTFGLRKGAKLIIEAANILIKQNIDFELNIVGDISNDIEIPDWFKNNKNIKLHGSVPLIDLKNFLSFNDIFIFPSYAEGCAQSLKIAMASGIPVIATKQSGGPINHLENGYLIPDHSSEALSEAILQLIQNKELRKKIGSNGAETIKTEHTWEKYGKELTVLYKNLLSVQN